MKSLILLIMVIKARLFKEKIMALTKKQIEQLSPEQQKLLQEFNNEYQKLYDMIRSHIPIDERKEQMKVINKLKWLCMEADIFKGKM